MSVKSVKKEIIQGNKKIIYEIYLEGKQYKGITVDFLDLREPMTDASDLSINPALYVHNIATNFNPNTNKYEPEEYGMCMPKECYIVDEDIYSMGLTHKFKGEYLGNIIFNTPNGKQIACFISQNLETQQRYYKFLDLTFGNILACTEWDMAWEYGGLPSDEEGHDEYLRALNEMKTEMEFTTQITENGKESLIDYNHKGITEEGTKKYAIFKSNIMDVLEKGYHLLPTQEKQKIEKRDNDWSR